MLFKTSNLVAGAIVAAATLTTAIPLSQQQQLKQNTLNAKKNAGATASSGSAPPPKAVGSTVNSTDDCRRVEYATDIADDKYCGMYFKSKVVCLAYVRG
ncbi:hypothetical protein HDU76_009424, partial [Blyttiomyces sp. JEL0837]